MGESNPPPPGCPFETLARERIAVLEVKNEHTEHTQDAILEELKAMRGDIRTLNTTLVENITKINTASSVGWTALSLWTRAIVFVLGGMGTMFGAFGLWDYISAHFVQVRVP